MDTDAPGSNAHGVLRCTVCLGETDRAEPGWRAFHADGDEGRLVVVCPACWEAGRLEEGEAA